MLVSGTFSEPQFTPDLAGVAKKQLQEKILGSGKDEKPLDKEGLEETAKGVLKSILGQ